MTYIISMRNPRTNKAEFVLDEFGEVLQLGTIDEAEELAESINKCDAWGYSVVEIP